jgi:two-component system CheB/CheR fusion protein
VAVGPERGGQEARTAVDDLEPPGGLLPPTETRAIRLSQGDDEAADALERAAEEFVATASHDLKAPLTAIIGYAQLLLRRVRVPEPDLGVIARGLAQIDEQARAMDLLLDELLDVSRIQTGAFDLLRAPCEIGECLATVLARLSPEERARVDVAPAAEPLAGHWDRRRLEQVLANLLDNALKYSPAASRVRVAAGRGPEGVEVAVADAGMGIRRDLLPRLFGRFYRTPGAHASGLPGTGLGLHICRGIVAAHGGRIWAESPGEGQGATFRFTLPSTPPTRADGRG